MFYALISACFCLGLARIAGCVQIEDLVPDPQCLYDRVDDFCNEIVLPEITGRYATDANLVSWPYLVSIQEEARGRAEGCFQHICAGVLITPRLVLSAAHCTDYGSLLGPTQDEGTTLRPIYITRAPKCTHQTGGERIEVDYIWKNPEWNRMQTSGDLAILKLKEPFLGYNGPYANYSASVDVDMDYVDLLRIVGWGASTNTDLQRITKYSAAPLQQAPVSYISYQLCYFYLGEFDGTRSRDFLDYDTMICTYSDGADTCNGDSGGPLALKGDLADEDIILGIVSWGPPRQCISEEAVQAPQIYTRVARYVPWIDEIVSLVEDNSQQEDVQTSPIVVNIQTQDQGPKSVVQFSNVLSSSITIKPLYFFDEPNHETP